jgi:two-component system, sensor histidine kinase and response regulator
MGAEVADLRARLAVAERSSEGKSRFIRHVSHEFRTPLGSIIGYAALLEREGEQLGSELRDEYLTVVLRNARHLLHVVNDLLNISKVEAGALEVTLGPVRVPEVVSAAAVALTPHAGERGIRLRVEIADGFPPVCADPGRLRQVLLNLLENAIKYSPEGSVIDVRALVAEGGVRIEIEDRGPGIAAGDQPRLFREFSRIHHPGMRVVGAGLGLALSRMLTVAMGGTIGVRSAPGEGSTFWVEFPTALAAPPEAHPASQPDGTRARHETVAIVEDDPDFRAYAAAVLERAGYRVRTDDGAAGIPARLAPGRPEIVLLDLHLAGRDGAAALRELRADPAFASVPVFTFSGGAPDPGAGDFAGHIGKPIEPDALVRAVDAALEAAGRAVPGLDDFLGPLRERFRAGLGARGDAVRAALASGDAEGMVRELHKLRGAAGGYGFERLSRAAAAAEESAGSAGAEGAMARLLTEIDRLV